MKAHVTDIINAVWGIVRALSELAYGPHDRQRVTQVLHKVKRHLHGCQVDLGRLIDALRPGGPEDPRRP